MPTTIGNRFSTGTTSVRSAFNTEGYGISNRLSAYRRGSGIVPNTSAFNVIAGAGQTLRLSQFVGFIVPSQASVSINNLGLTSQVGSTFSGSSECILTFNTNGTLSYSITAVGADPGRYVQIVDAVGSTIDSGEVSISGNVPGMWIVAGSASDFEINVSSVPLYGTLTGATVNVWTNMGNGPITMEVQSTINDAIDQSFNVSIRKASNQQVLDSAVFTMNALSAGIN